MRELGFTGGNVLEPGCGSGNFIGLAPTDTPLPTRMIGVELDPITAGIAAHLYPEPHAQVLNESFGDTLIPIGQMDAAVGNVPFGDYRVYDPVHNPDRHSIHNHFINKSLDAVRPGGVVAMITSRFTLDSEDSDARAALASKADLLGAIRLPASAHQTAAGTRVVTDILILRRRAQDEAPSAHNHWLNALDLADKDESVDKEVWANEYFFAHRHHVLGRLGVRRGQFGPELDVEFAPEDLAGAVREAFVDIARTARERGLEPVPARDFEPITVPSAELGRLEGLLQVAENGAITKMERGVAHPHTVWPAKDASELRQLIGLRDTYTALLDAESASAEDTDEMARLRAELNRRYDAYVDTFGPINRFKYNAAGNKYYDHQGQFRQDPMCSVVYALEKFDAETQTAEKASVFTRRVLAPRRPAETADTPADALALCLDTHGRVDLDEIARLLKAPSAEAAREALGTLVFDDPERAEHDRVVAAAEYLSGDVRRKLRTAQGLVATHPHLQDNIEALETVVPADLTSDQIDAKLGASWIDRSYVEQFARELLDDDKVVVENPGGGIWAVRGPESNPEATQTWGTDEFNAYELLTLTLNQKRVVVTRTIGQGKDKRTVVDQEATETARGKVEELRMRFSEWVWEDPERAEHLQEVYNDTFNGIALRSYDDVRLTLPGLDKDFVPRPHQYAAVARILNEPATLLAHPVGAGKTAEMVMGAMEMRRLGLAKKPVVVVPNHMLEQVSREWLQIYPQARLLIADGKKMKPKYRADFIAQCANGDWDAVVMTHAQFEKLPMSRAKQAEYMQRRIDDLQEWINGSDPSHDRITVKRLQRMLATAEERMARHLDKSDPGLCFEQSGIDALIVDEAHKFKNGQINSNIQEAAKEASGRADDMLMKTDFIHDQGGRVVFATATPIANSVSEAWMIQRYLRPDLLAERGLLEFDVWASTFGEVRPVIERNVDGDIREKDRFASFDNLPELLRMFHVFADIKTAKELQLPVPEIGYADPNDPDRFVEGPQTLIVPHTPEQWFAQLEIQSRAKSITGKNPGEHLVVRNHARYNALHRNLAPDPPDLADLSPEDVQRAIARIEEFNRLSAEEREQRMQEYYLLLQAATEAWDETPEWFQDLSLGATKADFAAHNIARIWEANKDTVYDEAERPGALQLVFCDLGTPLDEQKMKKSSRTFSVYEDLRDKLIARGVPAEEIRFIQETSGDDRKKAELFAACRDGRVSVLIGSTEMMGVGTNVQKRAMALHHLDCPWRPVDIEQREGRIERQGNLNPRAQVYRYVTPDSFDTVLWDTNVRKALFIAQVMAGQLTTRSIEDISSEVSGFALTQAMAANNPLEQKLAENHKTLSRLEKRHRGFVRSQAASEHTIKHAPTRIRQVETAISQLETALERRVPTRGDAFTMAVDGRVHDSRKDAGQALRQILLSERNQALSLSNDGEMTRVGSAIVGGFNLNVSLQAKRNMMDGSVVGSALIEFTDLPDEKGSTSTSYVFLHSIREIREISPHGLVTRLTNKVDALDERLRIAREQLPKEHKKLRTAQANLERSFPWEQELTEARELDAALRAELGMTEDKAEDEDAEVLVGAVAGEGASAAAEAPTPTVPSQTVAAPGSSASPPSTPAASERPAASNNEVLLQAARERGFLMEGTIGPDSAPTPATPPQPAAARNDTAAASDWTKEELAAKDAINELERASARNRATARDRVLLRLRQAKPHTDDGTMQHLIGSAHLADPAGPWDKPDRLTTMGLFEAVPKPERPDESDAPAPDQAPRSSRVASGEGKFRKARLSYERGPDGQVQVVATPVNDAPDTAPSADPVDSAALGDDPRPVTRSENAPAPDQDAATAGSDLDEVQAWGYVVASGRAYPLRCRIDEDGHAHTRMTPTALAQMKRDLDAVVDDPFGGPQMPDWPRFGVGTDPKLEYLAGVSGTQQESFVAFTRDEDGMVPVPFAFDVLEADHADIHPLPPVDRAAYEQALRHLGDQLPDPASNGSARSTHHLKEFANDALETYRTSEVTTSPERLEQISVLADTAAQLIEVGAVDECNRILGLAHQAAANPGEAAVWERQKWALENAYITAADLVLSDPKHRHSATVLRAAYALAADDIQRTHPGFHVDPAERARSYAQRSPVGPSSLPWMHSPHKHLVAVEEAGLRYEATKLYQLAYDQATSEPERDHWDAQIKFPYAPPHRRALIYQAVWKTMGWKNYPDDTALTERFTRARAHVVQAIQTAVRDHHGAPDTGKPTTQEARTAAREAFQLHAVLRYIDAAAAQGLDQDLQPLREAHGDLDMGPSWLDTNRDASLDTPSFLQARQEEVEVSVAQLRQRGELRVAVEAIDAYEQHRRNRGMHPVLAELRQEVMEQGKAMTDHLAGEGRAAHRAGDRETELAVLRQVWRSRPQAPADKLAATITKIEAMIGAPEQKASSEPAEPDPISAPKTGTDRARSLQASPPTIPSVEPVDLTPRVISEDRALLRRLAQAQHSLRSGQDFNSFVLGSEHSGGRSDAKLFVARDEVASAIEDRLHAGDRIGAWRLLGGAQIVDPRAVRRFTDDDALMLDLARHLVAEPATDTEAAQEALQRADQELLNYHVLNIPAQNRRPAATVQALLDQGLNRHAERFLELAEPAIAVSEREIISRSWTGALYDQHHDTVLPALLGEADVDSEHLRQARSELRFTRQFHSRERYDERDINKPERARFNDALTRLWLDEPAGRNTALALVTHANHVDPHGCWDRAELYSRLRYPADAFPDGLPDRLIRVDHNEEGTRLFGVPRAPKGSPLNEALTRAKFKYSSKEGGYWYLPRPWKVWTRQGRVNQLLGNLDDFDLPYITQARWQALHDGQAAAQDQRRQEQFRAVLQNQSMDLPGEATTTFRAIRAYMERERTEQAVHNSRETFGITETLYDDFYTQAHAESHAAKARYRRAKAEGAAPAVLLEMVEEIERLHPWPERVVDLASLREDLRAQVAQQTPPPQAAPTEIDLDAQVSRLAGLQSSADPEVRARIAAEPYVSAPPDSAERMRAQMALSDAVHRLAATGEITAAATVLDNAGHAATASEQPLWDRHRHALAAAAERLPEDLLTTGEASRARAHLGALYTLEWARTDQPDHTRGQARALIEQVLHAVEADSPQGALDMIWHARHLDEHFEAEGFWDSLNADLRRRHNAPQITRVEQDAIATLAADGAIVPHGSSVVDITSAYPLAYASVKNRYLLPSEESQGKNPLPLEEIKRRSHIIRAVRMWSWRAPDGIEAALRIAEAPLTEEFTGPHRNGDRQIPAWAGPLTNEERLFAHAWAQVTGDGLVPPTDEEVIGEAEDLLRRGLVHEAAAWLNDHTEMVRSLPDVWAGPERTATSEEFTALVDRARTEAEADLRAAGALYAQHVARPVCDSSVGPSLHGELYRHGEEIFLEASQRHVLVAYQYWARHDEAYLEAENLYAKGEPGKASEVIEEFGSQVCMPTVPGTTMERERDWRDKETLDRLGEIIDQDISNGQKDTGVAEEAIALEPQTPASVDVAQEPLPQEASEGVQAHEGLRATEPRSAPVPSAETALHPEEEARRLAEQIARQELERSWEEKAEQMGLNTPPAASDAVAVREPVRHETDQPAPTPKESARPEAQSQTSTSVQDRDAADAAFHRAGQARQRYQYSEALQELNRARQLDPSRADYWTWARSVVRADQASQRAGHLMRQGKFQASLASLKEASRLDPSRVELWERRRVQVQQARKERQSSPSAVVRSGAKVRPSRPEPPAAGQPSGSAKPTPSSQQKGTRR